MGTGAQESSESKAAVPEKNTPYGEQSFWDKEKKAADKRLRVFTRQGNQVVRRYLDERLGSSNLPSDGAASLTQPFRLNLFWTNISTQQSMMYGSTPRIDVSREHQDPDDDVARVAATMIQRMLEADVSTSGSALSTTLRACLQDRLLPGLGVARVTYGYASEPDPTLPPPIDGGDQAEKLTGEWCTPDYVHWQDFSWGWGRTWAEVPWVGFRSYLTEDQATERFGEEKAKNLTYKNQVPSGDEKGNDAVDPDLKDSTQKAEIWEFWNKINRTVYWWSEGADGILDTKPDPLKLDGFFPCPMPMASNLTTTLFLPKADFVMAQDLYNEIDLLQTRISIITRAIKVVGVYNKNAGDSVGRMLQEGTENSLIPVDNWAMFADSGGIKGNVEWFPVEEIVSTLQTLQGVRDATIDLLYQVTGMSDLLRGGDTEQYTSDGTNQLKAKFGSIRVQAAQDQFAVFASDLDALKAEVISKHFNPESIVVQSAAQFLPEADREKINPAIGLIKSPDCKWRVAIRPESIAMIDYAQLKSERVEYLTATATFLQSATSVVKEVPNSLPVLLEMMKWGLAGFKGANYLEGTLDRAIAMASQPKPPTEDPEAKAMQQQLQLEQLKNQFEMEKIQAKHQSDMELANQKFQMEMQQAMQQAQAKMAEQQAKSQGDLAKIMADMKADLTVINAKLMADVQIEQSQAEGAAGASQVEFENEVDKMTIQHQYTMDEIDEQNEGAEEEEDTEE